MSRRSGIFTHALTGAITLSAVATVVFFVTNTGMARASKSSDHIIDAKAAGPLSFAFIGLITFVAIIFFSGTDRGEGLHAELDGAPRGSRTLFTRDPLVGLMSIGPLFGLFFCAAALLWHTFAAAPGTSGTVWGDFTSAPLPFVVLFAAILASTNFGLTLAGITVAVRSRVRLALSLVFGTVIAGIGSGALFAWLAYASTVMAAVIAVPAAAVSALTLYGARRLAVSTLSQDTSVSARARRRGPTPPPFDALDRGESVLVKIGNRHPREQEFLMATAVRIVHARTAVADPTEILDEAAPNQLVEASTRSDHGHTTTVIRFRDRPAMRLIGTDAEEAADFARKLTVLARTGNVPD
ncbi:MULTISPECIES: hypothetical protein [unclassified Brevibacterium]|jgi:hypothetical protein|uniref:hypothetical protein n=1 Tax=unclassified Brevibacterium TaxID=2614124 RepID=UPI001092B1FD|nr:hypothetical protein [Brevibacterium sp. S22]TGD30184.1 hypothetical protein EB835_13790 [Brevibacterium sp. S22]